MFIAVHYVKINGVTFMPNEIITETIDPAKKARLLEKGAIRKSDAPFSERGKGKRSPEAVGNDAPAPDAGEVEAGQDGEAPPEESGMNADEDDEYEDAEAPEIDVSDSLTPAEEPEPREKKPEPKRRGRKE